MMRFGSACWEGLWIGPKGVVSVTGPVTGPATPSNLAGSPGAIAALWPDVWDTSEVRVHAGPAPKVRSWRAGEVVKGFAVEWRGGLRAPGWEPGRRSAMRLLLYEDGTYRTDFGAMEAEELGAMSLVTGWSGPGAHPATLEVDASTHAWGGAPAGSGAERVAYESSDAAKLSDLGHLWVRWNGYPERQDPAGPSPVITNAVRTNGKLTISGTDIAAGATVDVDVADRFGLKKKGSTYLVKKKTRPTGTGRTVTEIWSDGAPHSVFIVNSDGTPSAEVVVD